MNSILTSSARKLILSKVVPSKEEIALQHTVIRRLTEALEETAPPSIPSYSFIEPQGSTGGKQTQLRQAGDVDLFVGLRPDGFAQLLTMRTRERKMAVDSLLDSIVDSWFLPAVKKLPVTDVIKTYSQHPYLSLKMNGIEVDVVACMDMTAEELALHGPLTPVDRTVHHTRYVQGRLNRALRDDVRLLKSFVRASHAYGDRCAVGQTGFTGYSLELLVIFSDGVEEAVRRVLTLVHEPLDPEKRPLETLRKKPAFRDDYMIVIDPTDTERNVASSFSKRSCQWLMMRVRKLLALSEQGDEDRVVQTFLEKPIPSAPLPEWVAEHAFSREMVSDGKVHYTVLRDKLYHCLRGVTQALEAEETGPSRFGTVLSEVLFDDNRYAVGFIFEHSLIDETYSRRGPPVSIVQGAARFRLEHPDAYEKDGYLWHDVRREWTSAGEMAKSLMKRVRVKGLKEASDRTLLSSQVENVLFRYVMQVEPTLLNQRQEFKDNVMKLDE